jgi:enamine deaminase RidA (YjgF/YER057c/UK114 family)
MVLDEPALAVRPMASHGMPGEKLWGYSQAIDAGGLVHVSGQVPRDESERPLVGTVPETYGRAFDLLDSAIGQVGCGAADLVHVQLFGFAGDLDAAAEAYRERYGDAGAAMSLIVVDGLNHPDYRVEVSAVAQAPEAEGEPAAVRKQSFDSANPHDVRLGRASAVRVGEILYVSGQPSVGPDGEAIASERFVDHYRRAFENFVAAVEAAGGTGECVVSTHTFVTEPVPAGDVEEVKGIHHDAVGSGANRPASTLVRVSGVSAPGAKVEVAGVAVLPEVVKRKSTR